MDIVDQSVVEGCHPPLLLSKDSVQQMQSAAGMDQLSTFHNVHTTAGMYFLAVELQPYHY